MLDRPLVRILLGVERGFRGALRVLPNVVCRRPETKSGKHFGWGYCAVFVILSLVGLAGPAFMLSRFLAAPKEFSANKTPAMSVKNIQLTMPSPDEEVSMPSLPRVYWAENETAPQGFNATCAGFPQLADLQFNNVYWQTLRTSNGTFQLFGAYLDNRKSGFRPTVRVLGMIDRIEPAVTTYCQFWLGTGAKEKPVIVRSYRYRFIWCKIWGNYVNRHYQPYLIDCVLPRSHRNVVPESISLVENVCDNATNNLRVIYNKPASKRDFAVCVKGLDLVHQDRSVRLVEWIELLGLLGADKIFFYKLHVHPNIGKVLHHYEKEGKVHVTPLTLLDGQPNHPAIRHLYLKAKGTTKRQNELIPYNDCFYKHMYEYRYIALLDIDEVIMPKKAFTWRELMDAILLKANQKEWTSYSMRNVYFFDELHDSHGWFKGIPKYMHMLQHVYRAKEFSEPGISAKCFHNTKKVLAVHNHFPLACLGVCSDYPVNTSDALLHHYRKDCAGGSVNCTLLKNNGTVDATVWKFKRHLLERVPAVLEALGWFQAED